MFRQQMWKLVPFSLLLFLAGCGDPATSALNPSGPVAESQLSLIKLSLYIMLFVMAVVFVIFIYVVLRYRQRPGDNHIPKQVEGNHVLEAIWITIPVILLIILAVPTVQTTFTLAEEFPEDMTLEDAEEAGITRVQVTAHQFWWEFEYPDHDIVTAQDLYIPTGERVFFELTSNDVIHSFWIPALAGKTDTNPGEDNVNSMWIEADEPGVYNGKCAELCGASHALMDFKAVAVEPDEFDEWVESMQAIDGEEEGSTELAEQGREVFADSCIQCHATDGESSAPGPNLAGFGDRQTLAGFWELDEQSLEEWIRQPEEYKPEVQMPGFPDMSDEDMDALVEYLMDLTLD